MQITLTNAQKVHITLTPMDAQGNPAPVDGVPIWALSDPSFVTLEIAEDGMSAWAITIGPVGTCRLNVSADADLGEGIVTIAGDLDIEVTASQAVSLGINTDAPVPK